MAHLPLKVDQASTHSAQAIAAVAIGTLVLALLPLALAVFRALHHVQELLLFRDGLFAAITRTWAYSLSLALSEALAAYWVSALAWSAGTRLTGIVATLLLLPALAGEPSYAFGIKRLGESLWIGGYASTFGSYSDLPLLCLTEFLQFLPFAIFFTMYQLSQLPPSRSSFANSSNLTLGEWSSDVAWPQCRNLIAFLAVMTFLRASQDYFRPELLIRPSVAANNEFVSHWLLRRYLILSPMSPALAVNSTLAWSGLYAIGSALLAVASGRLTVIVGNVAVRSCRNILTSARRRPTAIAMLAGLSGATLALTPLLFIVSAFQPSDLASLSGIMPGLAAALGATSIAFAAALLVGISARQAWPTRLSTFGSNSVAILVCLALLLAIPPIGIVLVSGVWTRHLLSSGIALGIAQWFITESLLVVPFLTIVIFLVHFSLPNAELLLHRSVRASQSIILFVSFFSRFWLPYLFTLLLGWALIISESTASVFLSQLVPSIAPELLLRIDGRGTQFREAAVLVTLASAVALILAAAGSSLLRAGKPLR